MGQIAEMIVPDRAAIIDELTDDQLMAMSSYFVSHHSPVRENDSTLRDSDGFPVGRVTNDNLTNFREIQKMCWEKFNENPQINSHVRDYMGTLTGFGYNAESDVEDIDALIKKTTNDIRNQLYKNMTKYVARAEIEGELFLGMTAHTDGFIEVDFLEPSALSTKGDSASGIYFHPRKATIPVLYDFNLKMPDGSSKYCLIPSIYAAYYPQFVKETVVANKLDMKDLSTISTIHRQYKGIGGFKTFVVAWDRGFLTKRNVSHVKTTLEWINHYVNLKKWEIDHKKSSGAYLWVVEMEDAKALRTWLKMSEEEKANSGLAAKKVPGGTLILPPGMKLSCINPQLSSISEQDTDIMHMVTSGLNRPEDMVTGQTKGDTFSGVKASRGPQADRTKDEIAYFARFLRYDFWRSVLFLHNAMNPKFKLEYKVKKTVGFKNKEPISKLVTAEAYELVDFNFPQSEIVDLEARCRALLGVNHQSVSELLGIPKQVVAHKLGFDSYKKLRYDYQTEEDTFPELPLTADIMSAMAARAQGVKSPNTPGDDKGEETEKPEKEKAPAKP